MLYSLLVVLGASLCNAIPRSTEYVLHESRGDTPGWEKLGPVELDRVLPIRIGLSQNNLEKGEELVLKISDPRSEIYGKHLSSAEVIDLFKPSDETLSAVKSWLAEHNFDDARVTHSGNKGWLAFDATAEEAGRLLRTEFHYYMNLDTSYISFSSDGYHIPKHLVSHIDYVTPGVLLHSKGNRKQRMTDFARESNIETTNWIPPSPLSEVDHRKDNTDGLHYCQYAITDACIRALYHVPLPPSLHGKIRPQPNNSLGIFERGDEYMQENLNKFFYNYTPWIPRGTHPTPQLIDGAKAPGPRYWDTGESDLDFILAYPLIYPQKIKLFQVDDNVYNNHFHYGVGLFNTFLDAIDGSYCTYAAFGEKGDDPRVDPKYPHNVPGGYKGKLQCGVFKPTSVISISYGEQESNLPIAYQKRQCNEFLKLALQGVSILIASGDDGVAGPYACLGQGHKVFSPAYPVNCPWVTTVGATKVPRGRTVHDPEVAADDPGIPYSSGGGFSNIYPTPSYQEKAVKTYLTKHKPPYKSYKTSNTNSGFDPSRGVYNRAGRAIPDVAANGDNAVIYHRGKRQLFYGTSASAPIFASIINRINEERLRAGKSTLGFLNPALYENPGMLNDITEGRNPGCHSKGFAAVRGWDPVTGLGTPNYKRMLAFFMSLP